LEPGNDRSSTALERHIDSGGFGSLGIALLDDLLVVSNAENWLTEDGGNRVTFLDRQTGSLRATVELALGNPGHPCPDYPVPYVAPYGPPRDVAVLSPDPSWGCFPDPNGLAIGQASDGARYAFTANGGTDDVSVIDLGRVLRGAPDAELHRIPVQRGPWGITATPDGRHVIVSNGGSQLDGTAGNTLSILDVDRARVGASDTEVARVLVGTDDPSSETHPLIASVTPDGREIVVANIRAHNLSIVSLERVFAGDPDPEVARIPLTRADGRPARPKGTAVTPDGRYAIVSGGPGLRPYSQEVGSLYVIDLRSREVVATVTGVGNDPYGVAVVVR
ncbi:MAG: YncE family protein, partial [Gemmatimonadetes bacterium]|nr:YncE family protein [Gemmatimonadota bacterium]